MLIPLLRCSMFSCCIFHFSLTTVVVPGEEPHVRLNLIICKDIRSVHALCISGLNVGTDVQPTTHLLWPLKLTLMRFDTS